MSTYEKNVPEIHDIENIREEIANFAPFYERSFTKRYCVTPSQDGHYLDTCISVHSNKVCLLFLADGHSIIREGKTVKQLHFQVGKLDRLSNNVGGKRKRAAQVLEKNSVICFIETTDGTRYPLSAGIKAKLLEINPAVIKFPEQMLENYNTTKYIALVQAEPFRQNMEEILDGLLTRTEYDAILAERNK